MEWKGLRIAITNQEGEVFAIHNLGPSGAAELHEIMENSSDHVERSDDEAVKEALGDLTTAADNVRRQAVTDANNLIVSEG